MNDKKYKTIISGTRVLTLPMPGALLLASGVIRIHGLPFKASQTRVQYLVYALKGWTFPEGTTLEECGGSWQHVHQLGITLAEVMDMAGKFLGTAFLDVCKVPDIYMPIPKSELGYEWRFTGCDLFDQPVPCHSAPERLGLIEAKMVIVPQRGWAIHKGRIR